MLDRSTLTLTSLVLILGLGGCKNDEAAQIAALKTHVTSLKKENKEIKRRLADLEQLIRGGRLAQLKHPGAGNGLGGLGQIIQGLTGALASASRRGRGLGTPSSPRKPHQMAPDLQRRLDKLIVDSLEKLAQNPDAHAFVKEMFRAMRRDLAGKTPPPRP